ncbi:MAG: signal recognition particle protein [Chloroflexota bacterium]|jgi:signal recognition particle subunit SRP54|nr:signal recognition particle protein [Chloroflexota bacterium]
MLDSLSSKLQNSLSKMRSSGRIRDEDLDQTLREIRIAMLEADVHFSVVRDFLSDVRTRLQGSELITAVAPGQQVAAAVHESLIEILGKDSPSLLQEKSGVTKILVVGTKGSGKTTLCGRLALHFQQKQLMPFLVGTDFERVAASEQLMTISESIGVPCYIENNKSRAGEVVASGLEEAKAQGADIVIFDSTGIVEFTDEIADSLADLADEIDPTELLLVVDSMMGQEAVNLAKSMHEALEGTGIVVTKLDSDAKGGSVLSVRSVTDLPIKLTTTGEDLKALEEFHPERFASRLLGMGDIASLVEKAKTAAPDIDEKKVARKMKDGTIDLEDFLEHIEQIKNMGSLGGLLDMIPGANNLKSQIGSVEFDDKDFRRKEGIIRSMTPFERRNPDEINGSRRKRIAAGAGVAAADVNRLLNEFKQSKMLMQAMAGGGGKGGINMLKKLGLG